MVKNNKLKEKKKEKNKKFTAHVSPGWTHRGCTEGDGWLGSLSERKPTRNPQTSLSERAKANEKSRPGGHVSGEQHVERTVEGHDF